MKTVTFVIAAYKAEHWISEAIESCLSQSLPSDMGREVLVGIDACQPTLDGVRELRDPAIRCFYSETNVGPYVIYNSLHPFARNGFLVYHGADDVSEVDRTAKMLNALAHGRSPLTIVSTAARLFDMRTGDSSLWAAPVCGSFLASCETVETVGGFQPWRCAADAEFLSRAGAMGADHIFVPEPLLVYRLHDGQLTASTETGMGSDLRKNYLQLVREWEEAWTNGFPVRPTSPIRTVLSELPGRQ